MNYWFYMLKEVVESVYSYNNTENLEKDVFIATDREAAKKYLKSLYPDLPFRKPKNAVAGTRYLYLTDSSKHWYDYHHGTVSFKCSYCAKESSVVGEKNILKNNAGTYCSEICKTNHEQMMKDNSDFIHEDDHFGIGVRDRNQIVGYIYKITNKHTMSCYVGQTVKPPLFRWWQHLKVDRKFEQADITDLVFEVLEIVTFDTKVDGAYENAKDKLNKREAYYIRFYDSVEEGYNSVQPKELELDLFTVNDAGAY